MLYTFVNIIFNRDAKESIFPTNMTTRLRPIWMFHLPAHQTVHSTYFVFVFQKFTNSYNSKKMSIIRNLMNDSNTKNAFHFRISILWFHEAFLSISLLNKFLTYSIRVQPAFYTLTRQDERFCFNWYDC